MCIHLIIIAYFLTDTVNWQVLESKEKYLLNSLYEKLKNKVSLKQIWKVKNLSPPGTNKLKVKYEVVSF